ncbi:MAG: hypothetical protein ABI837_17310 [Acidobacteriota bacterium]
MRRALAVLSLTLLAVGCKRSESATTSPVRTAEARPARTATAESASGGWTGSSSGASDVTLRRADGSQLAVIHRSGENIEIRAGGTVLRGEQKSTGKRKYSSGSATAFEVKPGDSGFKLRTADGKLRWKVKITPEKIKISDNEENNNPFELKMKEGDRVKIVAPGERELGSVRGSSVQDPDRKELFRAEGGSSSAAYGVLLMDAIPETERYILVAELLAREK